MCFRPADVSGRAPTKCPNCGNEVMSMGGVAVKTCPYCHAELPDDVDLVTPGGRTVTDVIDATGVAHNTRVPSTPKTPSTPKSPTAPKTPSTPKAPGAPS